MSNKFTPLQPLDYAKRAIGYSYFMFFQRPRVVFAIGAFASLAIIALIAKLITIFTISWLAVGILSGAAVGIFVFTFTCHIFWFVGEMRYVKKHFEKTGIDLFRE